MASRLLKDNHLETWIWRNWRIVFSKHCLLLLCKGLIQDKVSEYNVSVHSWMHICVYTDVSRSCKQVVHSWLWAKLTKTSTPCGALMPACLNLASYKYKHTPGKVYISNICIQLRIYIWYQPLLKSAYLMENNLSFYSWSLRKEHSYLFSKIELFLLQISLSLLDWAFWPLVNAFFVQSSASATVCWEIWLLSCITASACHSAP